jgi:DNA repair exonuclease SbcCD nuclease subunit
VEHVAGQLRRLAEAAIRTVIVPGTHDVYDRASIYRAYDLASLAGLPDGSDRLVVLTPERPELVIPALDAIVYGRVFATKRAPQSPLAGFAVGDDHRATWRIGLLHGSVALPGRPGTDRDEVVVTPEEIASSGLDYLALGHWHSTLVANAGPVTYAYSGAPEPVAVDQDGAGKVLLVKLELDGERRVVEVEERAVGRTRFERLDIDAAEVVSQPALVERLTALGDEDLVLDVRITGVRPDDLDLEVDEVERAASASFHKLRVRDHSLAALPEGPLAPPDTIAGALVADLETRIGAAAAQGRTDDESELRDALRLARLLLAGHEVTL